MKVLSVRSAVAADVAFIADSWIDSFKTSHAAGVIPNDMYRRVYGEVVANVLGRPGVTTLVAYDPGDESGRDIYAWICHEVGASIPAKSRHVVGVRSFRVPARIEVGPVLHYAYTKELYRRMGFMTALLSKAGIKLDKSFTYTFKTGVWATIVRNQALAHWDPSIARYPKNSPVEAT